MNKQELIAHIADKVDDVTKTKIGEVVDAVFDALTESLKKGDEVRVPNFGIFSVVETAARKARNPQTNAEVLVPAGRRARFRPGKALKDALEAETKKPAPKSAKKSK